MKFSSPGFGCEGAAHRSSRSLGRKSPRPSNRLQQGDPGQGARSGAKGEAASCVRWNGRAPLWLFHPLDRGSKRKGTRCRRDRGVRGVVWRGVGSPHLSLAVLYVALPRQAEWGRAREIGMERRTLFERRAMR
jgi:hypothetical protein